MSDFKAKHFDTLEEGYAHLGKENERLRAQLAEFQTVFDAQWDAQQRAIKRWQAAHPGNDLTWPDHADLDVWLMGQLAEARTAVETEREECAKLAYDHSRCSCSEQIAEKIRARDQENEDVAAPNDEIRAMRKEYEQIRRAKILEKTNEQVVYECGDDPAKWAKALMKMSNGECGENFLAYWVGQIINAERRRAAIQTIRDEAQRMGLDE